VSKRGEAPYSVSVRKSTYERIEREAERRGIAVSSLVEEMVIDHLGGVMPPVRPFRKRKR